MPETKQHATTHADQRSPMLLILFSGLVFIFTIILLGLLASRLSIWGDEMDTISTAVRNWRGEKNFWWLLGQYNANPPGDNLMLRLYHKTGQLGWLRQTSMELYWRLPYLLVFAATVLGSGLLAWRNTGSLLLGLAVFGFSLQAPGLLTFAIETRFYIWLAFFMALSVWQLLWVLESANSGRVDARRFALLGVVAALGSVFHLMVVPVGYLVAALSVCFVLIELRQRLQARAATGLPSDLLRWLGLLTAGWLSFVVYKVQLKHVLFIPPPHADASFGRALRELRVSQILGEIAVNLPGPSEFWVKGALPVLALLLIAAAIFNFSRRRWADSAKSFLLLIIFGGTPLALYFSGAERHYPVMSRHMVYQVVVIAACLAHLWQLAAPAINQSLRTRLGAGLVLVVLLSAIVSNAQFATANKDEIRSKSILPFRPWREAYRALPDRRELVIVGASPNFHSSDSGRYLGQLQIHYAAEFRPVYLSLQGDFDAELKLSRTLRTRIQKLPRQYDFLLAAKADQLRAALPQLPWKMWKCQSFPGEELQFCRVP